MESISRLYRWSFEVWGRRTLCIARHGILMWQLFLTIVFMIQRCNFRRSKIGKGRTIGSVQMLLYGNVWVGIRGDIGYLQTQWNHQSNRIAVSCHDHVSGWQRRGQHLTDYAFLNSWMRLSEFWRTIVSPSTKLSDFQMLLSAANRKPFRCLKWMYWTLLTSWVELVG